MSTLTATVWYDKIEGVWHIKLSDGRGDKLPASATVKDLQQKCQKLGVRPENVKMV